MGKFLKIVGFSLLALVVLYLIWIKLPVKYNRISDIRKGNLIIIQIENYHREYGDLPKEQDWETLKTMEFDTSGLFLQPVYSKINDSTFELIFVEGFDPPYLLWDSKEKEWKMGNPTYVKKYE